MKSVLDQFQYKDPAFPVIANRNALPYENKASVVDNLSLQLISPIYWQNAVAYVEKQGITSAVEIGPKDVLKFLLKKNSTVIQPFTMDNEKDLQTLREQFLFAEKEYLNVIGRCLGAVVSTKNRNHDNESYEKEVVQPYTKIARLYETLKAEEKIPTAEQVAEALQMLQAVLHAKKVPQKEQDLGFGRVLGSRVVRNIPHRLHRSL
jgi:[acyl-carrier-protein] S-malonyltransferase